MFKHLVCCGCIVAILSVTSSAQEKKAFKPHPLAPSIPLLSDDEYAKIDDIINTFIDYDSGKLPQGDGKKILADFNDLGPSAIPPLVDGLNRAANLQSSCPAVIIAKKLTKLVLGTTDGQLLDYIRQSIGIGVTIPRHMNAIKDLKIACMSRKAYLAQNGLLVPPGKLPPSTLTTDELVTAAAKEKSPYVKQILTELEQRTGDQVPLALVTAISRPEADVKQLAQNLLLKYLGKKSAADLKTLLKSETEEIRLGVVFVIGAKKLPLGSEMIDALEDPSAKVQQLAHQALVQLAGGKDFGPSTTSSDTARAEAIKAWRHWWQNKSGSTGQNK